MLVDQGGPGILLGGEIVEGEEILVVVSLQLRESVVQMLGVLVAVLSCFDMDMVNVGGLPLQASSVQIAVHGGQATIARTLEASVRLVRWERPRMWALIDALAGWDAQYQRGC
jgi:hypothetical protein